MSGKVMAELRMVEKGEKERVSLDWPLPLEDLGLAFAFGRVDARYQSNKLSKELVDV